MIPTSSRFCKNLQMIDVNYTFKHIETFSAHVNCTVITYRPTCGMNFQVFTISVDKTVLY